MLALALIPSRREPDNTDTAKRFARALGAFLIGRRGLGAEVLRRAKDIDPDPQDLTHEHRSVDRGDEYRRRAVDHVLAACPYQL